MPFSSSLAVNPLFSSPDAHDFSLLIHSPALNFEGGLDIGAWQDLAPEITIETPGGNYYGDANGNITLQAIELAGTMPATTTWTSDVLGVLGNGTSLNCQLTPGNHTINVTVVDTLEKSDSDSISLTMIVPGFSWKYENIAGYYAAIVDATAGVPGYYEEAVDEVVGMDVIDPEIDLLSIFNAAAQASGLLYGEDNLPYALIQAVAALNDYVLRRASTNPDIDPDGERRFTDINDWLSATIDGVAVGRKNDRDDAFWVPSGFAVISALAGYPIDETNIDSDVGPLQYSF